MQNRLAPIVIFTYNRIDLLKLVIESLKKCDLSTDSELFVFSDGYKSEKDEQQVKEVREYLKTISGFKHIKIFLSEKNKGLASSIISGVTQIFELYNSIIVLEDDIVVANNFLLYMNKALSFYKENPKIFSISAYTIQMPHVENYPYDVYFTPRASSWGWCSWKDRWQGIDWAVKDFDEFKTDKRKIEAFNKGGSDLFKMLDRKMRNQIDSWAIRWCYHQFKEGSYTVFPTVSKVRNMGFSVRSTNSHVYNRYRTRLDNSEKKEFGFSDKVELNDIFYKEFYNFYSIKNRAFGKIYTLLYKGGLINNPE